MDYKKLSEMLFPGTYMSVGDIERKYPDRSLGGQCVVTRMAPSPTGFVHLGNLVQGVIAERMAHQSGGVLFLRVEDTDAKREVPGAVEVLIDTLKHYGIRFDEGATMDGDNGIYGPYRQSQRAAIYHVYAKKLVQDGMAYPCFCTEEELTTMREKQESNKETTGYYGKYAIWRDRSMEEIKEQLDAGNPWVLRFRSTGSTENQFKFDDLVKGKLTITENNVDHVLLKSDGIPTYHFAHVVDDHLMHTTHVVRGDEWLSTLPFHIQLFKALGFKMPKYVHIGPLMKMDGTSKRKLSKRKDPELALTYYKAEGFPVEAVCEYIMTVLNSDYEDWRRSNPDSDRCDFNFKVRRLNPAGSLFDKPKLIDISKKVISKMTADSVYNHVVEWADEYDEDFAETLRADRDYAIRILSIGRGVKNPRMDISVWSDARAVMSPFYDKYMKKPSFNGLIPSEDAVCIMSRFLSFLESGGDTASWFDEIKKIARDMGFASSAKEYKGNPDAFRGPVSVVAWVTRVAITGADNSPDLGEVINVIGRDRAIRRVMHCMDCMD